MKIRFSAAAFVCALVLLPASWARAGATVKSSKSNSSDREAAASTTGTQPVKTTTVKGSKSNSDNRETAPTGSTGPTPAPVGSINLNSSRSNASREAGPSTSSPRPAEATNFNLSRSNSYRKATSSISGTVTKVDSAAKSISLRRRDGSVTVLDASKLAGGLPKVGQTVKCVVTVTGKTQLIEFADPGVPPKK